MKDVINAPEFKMLLLKIDGQLYPGYKVPADPYHPYSHSSCIYWKIMPPNPIPYSEEWIIHVENIEGYQDFPEEFMPPKEIINNE